MSTGFNTDLQSILNNAKSQLSSLDIGGVSSASGNNYLNSVWGLVQDGQSAIDGNDQQKAQAITNMVQKLLSMVMSLGTNENSKATQEVKNNDNNAAQVSQKASDKASEVQSKVDEIVSNIKSGTSDIKNAIAQIEAIGGNQEDIKTAQEAVKELVRTIEKNLEIINDGVSKPDVKQKALANIKNASAEIQKLTADMSFLTKDAQNRIQEQNSVIEDATNNLSTLITDAATTISTGSSDLQSFIQNAAQQVVINTATGTTGAVNEGVGSAATATGASTSWIPFFGQSASTKLMQIGADQTAAGATRIGGAAKTLASLTQAIGKMGSDIQGMTGLVGSVQSESDTAVGLVGDYQTKLSSIITATGSWSQVVDANTELQAAVAEYEGQSTEGAQKQGYFQYGAVQDNNAQPQQNNGTLNFDPTRFKAAFGI